MSERPIPFVPQRVAAGDCAALLERSLAEVQERLEQQRALVRALASEAGDPPVDLCCPLIDCPRRDRYRAALVEVVGVLEETRRSFKSRQLEALRRKLMGLLAEP